MLKKLITGAVIGATATFGLMLGSGSAEAKIEPGHYKQKYELYGIIPTPESNVVVIGNTYYTDFYGIGAWNQYKRSIIPRKNGGTVFTGTGPVEKWVQRDEYKKTKTGYRGPTYGYGANGGNTVLTKVRPPKR